MGADSLVVLKSVPQLLEEDLLLGRVRLQSLSGKRGG